MPKKFSKKEEDFVCEHCGFEVKGTGYTNHCPKCLWSKHVDVNPGDRLEPCGGMMKPVDLYLKKQDWVLVHECESCSLVRKNRLDEQDDFNEVLRLEKKINEGKVKGMR